MTQDTECIEVKEQLTMEDQIDIKISVMKLSGLLAWNIKKRKIIYSVCVALGLLTFAGAWFISIKYNKPKISLMVISRIYTIISLAEAILAESLYIRSVKRNFIKNYKVVCKKYNIDFTKSQESCFKIQGNYIEDGSDDLCIKYFIGDYLRNFEEEKFYIIEFTGGRYTYFKKDTFSDKSEFDKIVAMIESKKKALSSENENGDGK